MDLVLDLRTIYILCGTTCLILGILQLAVYSTGKLGRWPLWWSASNLLMGLGIMLAGLRGIVADGFTVELGNLAQLSGYLFMPVAVRSLTAQPLNLKMWLVIIALASLPIPLFIDGADQAGQRIVFGSLVCLIVDIAVAFEAGHLARRERLYSAWFLMMLYIPTALIFALRAFAAHRGYIGPGDLLGGLGVLHGWLALFAVVFILLRSIAVVLIAAERGQKDLAALAHCDPLTGALNRAGMAKAYTRAGGVRRAMMLIDIDHFKQTNDTHGHAVGDDILMAFVGAARQTLSHSDLIGRHGGDEFIVVMINRDHPEVVEVANRVRKAYAEKLAGLNGNLLSTLSIGIAIAPDAKMPLRSLTQRADQALYIAKQRGRDTVHSYEDLQSA
jgi:diguanylate cyclase (GGDEF)-like protein